ncbi:MAG: molybdenum cofactor biosynthesis protein B [Cyanobacteria bacterium J06639_1]
MAGLDPNRDFLPVNIAVLTVSDTREIATDRSGQTLIDRIEAAGHRAIAREIVPDDVEAIVRQAEIWIARPEIDAIVATGGTGLTGRDVTPEAFHSLYDKAIPGFGEQFRALSFQRIGTAAMHSRATAGVARGTYLFAIPGSTGACRDAWDDILQAQFDNRYRPCNLVELMPRLQEHLQGQSPVSTPIETQGET